jgi:hypothetical protein
MKKGPVLTRSGKRLNTSSKQLGMLESQYLPDTGLYFILVLLADSLCFWRARGSSYEK